MPSALCLQPLLQRLGNFVRHPIAVVDALLLGHAAFEHGRLGNAVVKMRVLGLIEMRIFRNIHLSISVQRLSKVESLESSEKDWDE